MVCFSWEVLLKYFLYCQMSLFYIKVGNVHLLTGWSFLSLVGVGGVTSWLMVALSVPWRRPMWKQSAEPSWHTAFCIIVVTRISRALSGTWSPQVKTERPRHWPTTLVMHTRVSNRLLLYKCITYAVLFKTVAARHVTLKNYWSSIHKNLTNNRHNKIAMCVQSNTDSNSQLITVWTLFKFNTQAFQCFLI